MKKNEKKIFAILLLISVIMIAVSTAFVVRTVNYSKNGTKTLATITKIESRSGGNGRSSYDVYVEFFVDGVKYEGHLDTYVFTMKVGKQVPVYYLPDNPNDFTYGGNQTIFIAILYFSGVFTLCIALVFPISAIKRKQLEKFKQNATQIKAHINDIVYHDKSSFLGKHLLKISCLDDGGNEYSAKQYVINGQNVFITQEITVYSIGNKYKIDLNEVCNQNATDQDSTDPDIEIKKYF